MTLHQPSVWLMPGVRNGPQDALSGFLEPPLHPAHYLRACCPHSRQPGPAQPVFYLRSGLFLLAPENAPEGQIGRT